MGIVEKINENPLSPEEILIERKKLIEERWEKSTLSNDFIFHKLMTSEPDILKEIVELLLDKKVKEIVNREAEKVIFGKYEGKSIRLDVFLQDEEKMIDLEMQVKSHRNLQKRVRFYGSMMDGYFLEKGGKYTQLPDRYVVFLCTYDPVGDGMARNSFQNRNDVTGEPFGDGTYIYVYYTQGDKSEMGSKMMAFLDYVDGIISNEPFVQRLHEKVKKVKSQDFWRIEYMKYELDLIDFEERQQELEQQLEESDRAREESERAREESDRAREESDRAKEASDRAKEASDRAKEESDRAKEASERKCLEFMEQMKQIAREMLGTVPVEKIATLTQLSPQEILALS